MKKVLPLVALVILLVVVLGFSRFRTLSAAEILARMDRTYKECKSYRDSGTASGGRGNFKANSTFKTVFEAPDKFRFEFKADLGVNPEETRGIVWHQGTVTKSWYSHDAAKNSESLSMAVAEATGVSSLSGFIVPALLFPKEVGEGANVITKLADISRLDDEKIDDRNCVVINGKWGSSKAKLWVDDNFYAIRKVEIFLMDTPLTIHYKPEMNAAIDNKELEFGTP